jgi:hypothetical protein
VATQAAFLFIYAVTPSIIGSQTCRTPPLGVNDQAKSGRSAPVW